MSLFKQAKVTGQDILAAVEAQENINLGKEATANDRKLIKAIEYLNKAAEIFDNAGLNKKASHVTKIVEVIIKRAEGDDPFDDSEYEKQYDEAIRQRNKFHDELEANRKKLISNVVKYVKFRLGKDDFRDIDELKEGIFDEFIELNELDDGELVDKIINKLFAE